MADAAIALPKRTRKQRGTKPEESDDCGVPGAAWTRPPCQYEYLDHTADVQLHAWGSSLEEALGQVVVAMTGYITDIRTVEAAPAGTATLEVVSGDLLGLVYHLLDEALFRFAGDGFAICDAQVTELTIPGGLPKRVIVADASSPPLAGSGARLRCVVHGEAFDTARHPSGTEVKAITYSLMSVQPPTAPSPVCTQIAAAASGAAASASARGNGAGAAAVGLAGGPESDDRPYAAEPHRDDSMWHLFVVVDI